MKKTIYLLIFFIIVSIISLQAWPMDKPTQEKLRIMPSQRTTEERRRESEEGTCSSREAEVTANDDQEEMDSSSSASEYQGINNHGVLRLRGGMFAGGGAVPVFVLHNFPNQPRPGNIQAFRTHYNNGLIANVVPANIRNQCANIVAVSDELLRQRMHPVPTRCDLLEDTIRYSVQSAVAIQNGLPNNNLWERLANVTYRLWQREDQIAGYLGGPDRYITYDNIIKTYLSGQATAPTPNILALWQNVEGAFMAALPNLPGVQDGRPQALTNVNVLQACQQAQNVLNGNAVDPAGNLIPGWVASGGALPIPDLP